MASAKLCSSGLGEPSQGQGSREPPLISVCALGGFSIPSIFLIHTPSFIAYNYASSVTGIGTEDKVWCLSYLLSGDLVEIQVSRSQAPSKSLRGRLYSYNPTARGYAQFLS